MATPTIPAASGERPSALVDYIVIFNREEDAEARLGRRFPEDDILGSALPVAELTSHANDASTLDPAVSFSVCDTSGNLFHCTRIAIRPESHRELEYVIVIVSRRPRYKFFQDALIGIKTLFHIGDDIIPHLQQLLFATPSFLPDRAIKACWEGVGELTIGTPMLRCGFPEVDDYSMNLLLDSLSPELLTICVESLLKEENVVLTSHRPQFLTPCVEALKSLLYPFQWVGICSHLVPKDSITRALSRKGLPFLFGIGHLPYSTVREILGPKHQSDPPRCFLVNLDEGKGEWMNVSPLPTSTASLSCNGHNAISASGTIVAGDANMVASASPSSISSVCLSAEHRRIIADQYHAQPRVDKVRLACCQVLLDMFHHYKHHVSSWSTSSSARREAGFDCESFLSQTKLDNFDFVKAMLPTRMFGDFVSRVVNNSAYTSATFDKLCKAWPPTELPHAARELLMRRYGYTERGAKAVWARVRHLHNDPNLFSSKNFRDFVSELGLSKDGPPSTGDPVLDEFYERQARIEGLANRESEKACPPLVLPLISRQARGVGAADGFPPVSLDPPISGSATPRLPAWIPRREDAVHFSKPSNRATYLAFCRHPSDDELLTWRSITTSRPKLHLSFAGGSSELKSALKQSEGGKLPKPISTLTCAMKWAQLQGKRSLYDANQVLFSLLMEERARHREDMRRLRDKPSSASASRSATALQFFGSSSTTVSSSSSSNQQQLAGDPEMNHQRPQVFFDPSSHPTAAEAALEARVRELEERLREKELEVETLTRQLKNTELISAGIVRKTEPLFSPKHERPSSPASVTSSQSSIFTSPVATPRRYSVDTPTVPLAPTSVASVNSNISPSHQPTTFRVMSPTPYPAPPQGMTKSPSFRMGSPPPLVQSKSYMPSSAAATNIPSPGGSLQAIRRSASSGDFGTAFKQHSNQQQQPQSFQGLGQQFRKHAGSPPPSSITTMPPGGPQQTAAGAVPLPTTAVTPMTPLPDRVEEARKERNQRMWDTIEKGSLDSSTFNPEHDL